MTVDDASGTGTPVPALVFLHGTTGEGLTHFGLLADRFTDRRRVVLADYAGSGTSQLPDGPFTLDQLVDEVVGIVQGAADGADDPQPVDLVGYSLGAVVAAAVAAEHPELVRRLVLIAGWPTSDDPRHRLVFDIWARLWETDPELCGRYTLAMAFSPSFLHAIGHEGITQLAAGKLPDATGRQIDLGLRIDITDRLARITAPTLVVGCTRDTLVPIEHSRALHAGIPASSYTEIDTAHGVMFENADALTTALRTFLFDEP